MSSDPKADDPQTPQRDEHDNEEFGTSGAAGQGYPEEQPSETVPDEADDHPRSDDAGDRDAG